MTAVIVWVKMLGRFVPKTRQELSGPEGAPIAIATQDTRVSVAARLAALSALTLAWTTVTMAAGVLGSAFERLEGEKLTSAEALETAWGLSMVRLSR